MRLLLFLFTLSTMPLLAAHPDNIKFIEVTPLPGFRHSPWFGEQVREEWHEGCRFMMNVSGDFDGKKPTHLVIFATPNGNTIEQTLGCGKAEGMAFNFDIQHVAAQVRRLRELTSDENTVLAVVEANGLSWPTFRSKFKDNPERIKKLVERITALVPGDSHITLTGHSGGGSFITGFINADETLPNGVTRIGYLDSNYSYSDDEKHGDKLLAWLQADKGHRLIVIAYDDREIMLNGKKVVSETGGTWRATDRMLTRFKKDVTFEESKEGDFDHYTAIDKRLAIHRHRNPMNKILHTALVGEMNGLMEVLADGRDLKWGTFPGPRAYTKWVQPAPGIPPRAKDAKDAFVLIMTMSSKVRERELEILKELLAGNLPEFERKFVTVKFDARDTAGKSHTVSIDVMPDYLALGSDDRFIRMPMTPQTATRLSDAWGCVLPTRALVDRIHEAATVKLEPKPLGEPREALEQFANHNSIIEDQRKGKPLGDLISGVKKDIVFSNRIFEKPNRLAIYGWHQLDGKAIQPLTIVHVDHYVDYSHGVRFMKRTVMVDGKPRDIRDLYRDAVLSPLVSDEGVLTHPGYE
ncbi:hypothetical protein BH11PLA2_BH11PLA2_39680 [soil metagenome]